VAQEMATICDLFTEDLIATEWSNDFVPSKEENDPGNQQEGQEQG
jgi:hypothetical protein